jgi:hypothetical protein
LGISEPRAILDIYMRGKDLSLDCQIGNQEKTVMAFPALET